MISKIYAVKDELMGTFHNPVFLRNCENTEKEILRIFKYQVNNTPIWDKNPEDFSLYMIGSIDDETGVIISEITKIAGGRSVLEEKDG